MKGACTENSKIAPSFKSLSDKEISKKETMLSWSIFDKSASPAIRKLNCKNSVGNLIDSERWITFPQDPSIVSMVFV